MLLINLEFRNLLLYCHRWLIVSISLMLSWGWIMRLPDTSHISILNERYEPFRTQVFDVGWSSIILSYCLNQFFVLWVLELLKSSDLFLSQHHRHAVYYQLQESHRLILFHKVISSLNVVVQIANLKVYLPEMLIYNILVLCMDFNVQFCLAETLCLILKCINRFSVSLWEISSECNFTLCGLSETFIQGYSARHLKIGSLECFNLILRGLSFESKCETPNLLSSYSRLSSLIAPASAGSKSHRTLCCHFETLWFAQPINSIEWMVTTFLT